jgi:hypothetical protein
LVIIHLECIIYVNIFYSSQDRVWKFHNKSGRPSWQYSPYFFKIQLRKLHHCTFSKHCCHFHTMTLL